MIYSITTLFIFTITLQIVQSCQCPENQLFNPKTNSCIPDTPKQDSESYQEGCKSYEINNKGSYICKSCKITYYPSRQWPAEEFICEKSKLKNCKFIHKNFDTNSQYQQKTKRFLGNSTVEPPPYESNLTVKSQTQAPQCTCNICIDGYYVNNNTCIPKSQKADSDYIEKCSHYYFNKNKSQTQCEYCLPGYYTKDTSCEKNPTTPKNCSYFQWNQSKGNVECGNCERNHYFNSTTNECFPYNITVDGCLQYGFINSTQSCLECDDYKLLIWYNGTYCGKIENKLPGCFQAYISKSYNYVCQSCDSSRYYLKQGKCESFPSKNDKDYIQNCTQYEYDYINDVLECYICEGQLVAHQRKCIAPTKVIKNCGGYRYDEETQTTQCSHCSMNYTSRPQQPIHKCYQCLTGGSSANILILGLINLLLILFITL